MALSKVNIACNVLKVAIVAMLAANLAIHFHATSKVKTVDLEWHYSKALLLNISEELYQHELFVKQHEEYLAGFLQMKRDALKDSEEQNKQLKDLEETCNKAVKIDKGNATKSDENKHDINYRNNSQ